MRRAYDIWTRYWFAEVPALDLAVVRIVVVGFQLALLLWWDPVRSLFPQLSAMPDGTYEPLRFMRLLSSFLGGDWRPSEQELRLIYYGTVFAGAAALVGFATNAALAVFTLGNLILCAYAYSFGEVHHPEALLMICLAALTLSPSGRALSVDELRRRRARPARTRNLATSRWPLLLVRWMFALVYLSAAFYKLRGGGPGWLNGHTLRYYLISDGLRWDAPLGLWLADQPIAVLLLSWFTPIFEGTFFLAVLFPALALLYVPAGIAFHVGIYACMKAPFFQYIALYSVFVPWGEIAAKLQRRISTSETGETAAYDSGSSEASTRTRKHAA